MTENIFGENKEEESPMNALRGFRIGDIVEYQDKPYFIDGVNADCTLDIHSYGIYREYNVNPKEITRNISRGD